MLAVPLASVPVRAPTALVLLAASNRVRAGEVAAENSRRVPEIHSTPWYAMDAATTVPADARGAPAAAAAGGDAEAGRPPLPAATFVSQSDGRPIFAGGLELLFLRLLHQRDMALLASASKECQTAVQAVPLTFTSDDANPWPLDTVHARSGAGGIAGAVSGYRRVFPHAKAIRLASDAFPVDAALHLLPFTELDLRDLPGHDGALTDTFVEGLAQRRQGCCRTYAFERDLWQDENYLDGELDMCSLSEFDAVAERIEKQKQKLREERERNKREELGATVADQGTAGSDGAPASDAALVDPVRVLRVSSRSYTAFRGTAVSSHGLLQDADIRCAQLSSVCRFAPCLRKLTLDSGRSEAEVDILEGLPQLQEVVWHNYFGDSDQWEIDLGAADMCPNLVKLELHGCDSSPNPGGPTLVNIGLSKLETLVLDFGRGGWREEMERWLSCLPTSIRHLTVRQADHWLASEEVTRLVNLETLELEGCTELNGVGLFRLQRLRQATFRNCKHLRSMGKAGAPPPALTSLVLDGCDTVGDEGLAPVAGQLVELVVRGFTGLTQAGVDACTGLQVKDTGGGLPRPRVLAIRADIGVEEQ